MKSLVLLHGLCGSPKYFEQLEPLLDADVHALTLPGHAGTEAGPETMDQFADWVIEEIRLRELERPFVLGHSFGGYVTTNLVRRYESELSGFGLIHSTAAADSDEAKEKRNGAIHKVIEEGVEPFIDGMIPNVFSNDSDPELIRQAIAIGYEMTTDGIVNAQRAIRDRTDEVDAVEMSNLPGLFIFGEKDPNMDRERAFLGASPHTTAIVPYSHMGMMESPQEEAAIINQWIQEVHHGKV
ncbi:alpha/beta fold hydrolase [Exiguobacterium qingdaonense]|uniref:alpha/beta fold hydrolase n=1 Tax=Exiguobacterium qingdaonense TaxID=2751251 RepID=UPI001BE5E96F|nr:alpha/beta hydrolase [Exiguobacterium qingdaonense]